ncbi:hypothetical protein MMPV_007584 [Pyropia vietnamensis]
MGGAWVVMGVRGGVGGGVGGGGAAGDAAASAAGATSGGGAAAAAAAAATAAPHPADSSSAAAGGLTTAQLDATIWSLAIPALGSLLCEPVLSLVDTAFIGRLPSAAALGGLGIATLVTNSAYAMFGFLGVATTPLVARPPPRLGSASAAIATSLSLALFAGTALGIALYMGAVPLAVGMGATPGVTLPHTVGYLRGRAMAAPAVLGLLSIHGAYRGLRDTVTPLRITVTANVVNLVLDPVLIFGAGLGAAGAALATSASQVLALGLLLRRLVTDGLLRPADLPRVRPRWWGPLLRAGAALTVRTGAILATVAAAGATAAGGGAVASAAFEITRGLWVLSAMALDSLAHAAQALVAGAMPRTPAADDKGGGVPATPTDGPVTKASGEPLPAAPASATAAAPPAAPTALRRGRTPLTPPSGGSIALARRYATRALTLGLGAGVALGAAAFAAAPLLPRLFTLHLPTATAAASCVRVAALAMPINATVFVLDGVMAGVCDWSFLAAAVATAGGAALVALAAVRSAGVVVAASPTAAGVAWVFAALNVLMAARAAALLGRFFQRGGPLDDRPSARG